MSSIIKAKLFKIVEKNKHLKQITRISHLEYRFDLGNNKYFSVEKESDIDDDRWFYWFVSNLYSLEECYSLMLKIIKNQNA